MWGIVNKEHVEVQLFKPYFDWWHSGAVRCGAAANERESFTTNTVTVAAVAAAAAAASASIARSL